MKRNVYLVLSTMSFEGVFLWIVSVFFGWKYIDTVFLGALVLFGLKWLITFYIHQENNQHKAWTHTGEIEPFEVKVSPITIGMLLFLIGSFTITLIAYSSYFFS